VGAAFIAVFGPGPHHALSTMLDHGGFLPCGMNGLLAAIPVVIFSMFGSEMATIAAAESADPAENIAKAGRSVALRIAIFYVFSVALITAIVPWNTLVIGLSPFKAALDAIGIPGSGQVMSVIVLTAVLSALNSAIYISSRMLFELGRSGDGPRFLQNTARNRTPWIGVLICFAAGSIAMLSQFFVSQDIFSLLAGSAGAIMLFIYILIALAEIRQRRRLEAAGIPIPLKVWLFPWLSYASIVLMVGVLVVLASMPEQRLLLTLSAATVMIVFGALWAHRSLKRPKR
jgi:GABA permease